MHEHDQHFIYVSTTTRQDIWHLFQFLLQEPAKLSRTHCLICYSQQDNLYCMQIPRMPNLFNAKKIKTSKHIETTLNHSGSHRLAQFRHRWCTSPSESALSAASKRHKTPRMGKKNSYPCSRCTTKAFTPSKGNTRQENQRKPNPNAFLNFFVSGKPPHRWGTKRAFICSCISCDNLWQHQLWQLVSKLLSGLWDHPLSSITPFESLWFMPFVFSGITAPR